MPETHCDVRRAGYHGEHECVHEAGHPQRHRCRICGITWEGEPQKVSASPRRGRT